MFKLFKKEKPFFEEWNNATSTISPFIPEQGTVGCIKLGDRLERVSQIGKPETYNQVEKNHYILEYPNLTIECEDGFLTYIGCTFGNIEVKTSESRIIEKEMNVDQVRGLFGAPDQNDVDDLEDVVLTYTKNNTFIEFEFGSGQELIRVNCFRK